jgi:hypothetical protein
MKRRPVVEIDDGEWVTIAWIGQREKCCGCGRHHDVDHRVKDGKLQFRAVWLEEEKPGGRRRD